MRYSHQRELIENILGSRYDHPTADEIYLSAKEIEPNISLGTVYRNLKALSDCGKILTIETVDKKVRYDGHIKPHSHFICSNCGKVYDVSESGDIPKELVDNGFKVNEIKSVFYGQCSECANK